MSTDDATADFAGLAGAAQQSASSFDMTKTHPVFGAVHSMILAHRYGKESPYTYMNNPGLRAMDTREAAFEGMQKLPERYQSLKARFSGTPTVPSPVSSPMARPYNTANKPTQPPNPLARPYNANYSQRMTPVPQSQPMTPPGTPIP